MSDPVRGEIIYAQGQEWVRLEERDEARRQLVALCSAVVRFLAPEGAPFAIKEAVAAVGRQPWYEGLARGMGGQPFAVGDYTAACPACGSLVTGDQMMRRECPGCPRMGLPVFSRAGGAATATLPSVTLPRSLWFRWERRLDPQSGYVTDGEPEVGDTISGPWRPMTPEEAAFFRERFGDRGGR